MAEKQITFEFATPPLRLTPFHAASIRLPNWPDSFALIACLWISSMVTGLGQTTHGTHSSESAMQQHYDAAFRLQDSGQAVQADSEHKLFLGLMLHRIANGRANLGEYARAVPLYEDALKFTPQDSSLLMDYAGAALDAQDPIKATLLVKQALTLLPKTPVHQYANAVSLLAQALWLADEHKEALEQFTAAAALQSNFKKSYALATAYLALGDKASAAKVFSQMQATLGNTAALHMQIGRAYALTRLFADSIEEFQIAIVMDKRLSGVHYSLGASYMQLYDEKGYARAEAEFRKELALHPNDSFTYPQLGRIAMSRHEFVEAEADLKRGVQLDPSAAGSYLALGELYNQIDRPAEAEAALRNAVAATIDPTNNNYEGQRAYYWLGRVLIDNGKIAEARKYLKIAEDLALRKKQDQESELSNKPTIKAPLDKTRQARPADIEAESAYEHSVGPLIASSYDNLAVHAAIGGNYPTAAEYFERTALWNPTLGGLDRNWGRAAFAAQQYASAVGPLSRTLQVHPDDVEARSLLGLSEYFTHDYSNALLVLRPLKGNLETDPALSLAYAGAMLKAGDRNEAVERLTHLTQAHPQSAMPHCLLGEAHASDGQYELSVDDFRTALQLDPSNTDARYSLSLSLIALEQESEARNLLSELAVSGSKNADVYYQLGRLLLGFGEVSPAVANLEKATSLTPENAGYHRELSEAYRRSERLEDSAREAQLFETLRARYTSAKLSSTDPSIHDTPSQKN